MKKGRFNEHQIMRILERAEGGAPVPGLCRQHGMGASVIAGMEALIEENKRLKRMSAESRMENETIKEALTKKW